MPELPEVESFLIALASGRNIESGAPPFKSLVGRVIESVWTAYPPNLEPNPATVRKHAVGLSIVELRRRGKYLVFILGRGCLSLHLRMSGRVLVLPKDSNRLGAWDKVSAWARYPRLALGLSGGNALVLDDARKFGRLRYHQDYAELDDRLGPDAIAPGFSLAYFCQALAHSHRPIKSFLLDQSIVAGIGNIYADESLWQAGIDPRRLTDDIGDGEARLLRRSIRSRLRAGIRRGGASIDWVYPHGGFQDDFRVYGRQGLSCPRCGGTIQSQRLGQRSSHFCPGCQT